jgi:hypothetical protein
MPTCLPRTNVERTDKAAPMAFNGFSRRDGDIGKACVDEAFAGIGVHVVRKGCPTCASRLLWTAVCLVIDHSMQEYPRIRVQAALPFRRRVRESSVSCPPEMIEQHPAERAFNSMTRDLAEEVVIRAIEPNCSGVLLGGCIPFAHRIFPGVIKSSDQPTSAPFSACAI